MRRILITMKPRHVADLSAVSSDMRRCGGLESVYQGLSPYLAFQRYMRSDCTVQNCSPTHVTACNSPAFEKSALVIRFNKV